MSSREKPGPQIFGRADFGGEGAPNPLIDMVQMGMRQLGSLANKPAVIQP